MTSSFCFWGLLLLSSADALHWAFLVTGSNTWRNYRHQADLCHVYQILVSKGFSKDRIVTMSFDDVPSDELNPFPGQLFNSPTEAGTPGVDVYDGCNIDYRGKDVTNITFANLLLGTGEVGGNGRTLDMTADDTLLVAYFDHGAKGYIQFPDKSTFHKVDFQNTLTTMHDTGRYGRMAIYMEACNSGSMFEGLSADLNIYGVTAQGPDAPSMGTYCGYKATIDGTLLAGAQCLGDLFAVTWQQFVVEGDGTRLLETLFQSVYEDVLSFSRLSHGGPPGGQYTNQYGDLSMGKLTVADIFYCDSQSDVKLATAFTAPWVAPNADTIWWVPNLATESTHLQYNEASATPLLKGEAHWREMLKATDDLQDLLNKQKGTQQVYWDLVLAAYPDSLKDREKVWTANADPSNPECETETHYSLVTECASKVDLATSYASQFHQVVVNLCHVMGAESTHRIVNLAKFVCISLNSEHKGIIV